MGIETVIKGLTFKEKFDVNAIQDGDIRNKCLAQNVHLGFYGDSYNIPIVPPMLSQHILFTGGIGTGKTNAIFQLVNQIIKNMSNSDVMVIFDSKGDFYKEFNSMVEPGRRSVLSNDSTATEYWNMFNEAMVDYKKNGIQCLKESFMELANSIFNAIMVKDSQPFFPMSAKNIFYGMLVVLFDKFNTTSSITNKTIYDYSRKSIDDIISDFQNTKSKDELIQFLDCIGTKDPKTGLIKMNSTGASVMATLRNVFIDIFQGNFVKDGSFSIREFIRNKGKKVLFVEYDIGHGKVLGPIYKTIIDFAIKEALSRDGSSAKGNVFFVIDEFRLLPKLDFMDAGVNLGRGLGLKFIIGIQNIKQIDSIYGDNESRSILSGFVTSVNFRTTDQETREFIKDHFGEQIFTYDEITLSGGKKRESGFVITDNDILKLNTGEAIISVPVLDKNPIKFKFQEYEKFVGGTRR